MATNDPSSDHKEDNFVLELKRIRQQIQQKFSDVTDLVKARECELLKELDTIIACHQSYRNEIEKISEKKRDFEAMKKVLELDLSTSVVKTFQTKYFKEITEELQSIKIPAEPQMIQFVCDNNNIFSELNKLGSLVEKVKCVDYKSKVHPIVSVGEKGEGKDQLCEPYGTAVDNKNGNIFVADRFNNCVKVFDSSGKVLFKFGDSDGMSCPRCLVITENRILISNGDYSIHVYQLNGDFVLKIGRFGKGEGEINYPRGITYDESSGDVYICDSKNNRVQILSKEFTFKSQFGADRLKRPRDVKLSKEHIFILDESNPCLHLYSYDLILVKSVISRGRDMQAEVPLSFFIDNSKNILVTDLASDCVHIFNPQQVLIHKIHTTLLLIPWE